MDVLKAKVRSHEDWVDKYLLLWNGGIQLTDKELAIMKEFILLFMRYSNDGVKQPTLNELIFSIKNINNIKTKLEISKQNWSNYKQKLIEKKALYQRDGEECFINPILIPRLRITFEFEIVE